MQPFFYILLYSTQPLVTLRKLYSDIDSRIGNRSMSDECFLLSVKFVFHLISCAGTQLSLFSAVRIPVYVVLSYWMTVNDELERYRLKSSWSNLRRHRRFI
jgi:hypothetical protein